MLDQNRSENKTETSALAMRAAALTPMEQRVEDERQEYDVRHLMRLKREGEPFRKYLDDDSDILGATEVMPMKASVGLLAAVPRFEFSPRGRLMFHYLEGMRLLAKQTVARVLQEAPIIAALEREDLLYWWGAREQDLVRMVHDWGKYARACKAKGEPIPTPAYWLLMHRPPQRFEDAQAILGGIQKILVTFIVDAELGEDVFLTERGTAALRGRRLS